VLGRSRKTYLGRRPSKPGRRPIGRDREPPGHRPWDLGLVEWGSVQVPSEHEVGTAGPGLIGHHTPWEVPSPLGIDQRRAREETPEEAGGPLEGRCHEVWCRGDRHTGGDRGTGVNADPLPLAAPVPISRAGTKRMMRPSVPVGPARKSPLRIKG
jgi:hypothetical protein